MENNGRAVKRSLSNALAGQGAPNAHSLANL
jgi:hypothetical protein